MLRKISQTENDKCYRISRIYGFWRKKTVELTEESTIMVLTMVGRGRANREMLVTGYKAAVAQD